MCKIKNYQKLSEGSANKQKRDFLKQLHIMCGGSKWEDFGIFWPKKRCSGANATREYSKENGPRMTETSGSLTAKTDTVAFEEYRLLGCYAV
jgi:hypothetical protein